MTGNQSYNNKIPFYFVVVIYNKECANSYPIRYALKNSQDIIPLVIDNSTIETSNYDFCLKNDVEYYKMNGNEGLAKAYNQALRIINNQHGYVIWSDDDTIYPDNFITEVQEVLRKESSQVLIPLVYSNDRIYSPAIIDKYGVPKQMERIKENGGFVSGINSGMAVRLDTYNTFRYDERFFLDMIDHDFCCWCNEHGIKIDFNNSIVLHQNVFFDSNVCYQAIIGRRKIYKKDFIYFCQKHKISKAIAYKKLLCGGIANKARFIKSVIIRKKT